MSAFFRNGQYMEGDMQYGDVEVPQRPSAAHTWDDVNLVWVDPTPPTPPTLQERQDQAWSNIKAKRTTVENGGVLVATKWFHTDSDSRIKHLGLVMMGAGIPVGTMWKTMDGTFIEMTQVLAGQIFSAVAQLDSLAFAQAEIHNTAMKLEPEPETYDFSAGWPVIYVPV